MKTSHEDLNHTQNQKIKPWTDPAFSLHSPETVQVFSNSTPVTYSSVKLQ